jgi:hypothetical protein
MKVMQSVLALFKGRRLSFRVIWGVLSPKLLGTTNGIGTYNQGM